MAKVPLIPPGWWRDEDDIDWGPNMRPLPMTEETLMLIAEGEAELWNGTTVSLEDFLRELRNERRRERRRQLKEEVARAKLEADAQAAAQGQQEVGQSGAAAAASSTGAGPNTAGTTARRRRPSAQGGSGGGPRVARPRKVIGLRAAPDYAAEARRRRRRK
jgi:hypothetical protein